MRILNVIICFFAISTCAHLAGSTSHAPEDAVRPATTPPSRIRRSITYCLESFCDFYKAFRRSPGSIAPAPESHIFVKEPAAFTALIQAIIAKDNAATQSLLTAKPALATLQDTAGMTALMYAAQCNNHMALPTLIYHKASVHKKNLANETALHFAAQARSLKCIVTLMGNYAEINAQDNNGNTPLMVCINTPCPPKEYARRRACCKALITPQTNLEIHNNEHQTALWLAAATCNESLMVHLIDNGANIDAADRAKVSALTIAAQRGIKKEACQRLRQQAKDCAKLHVASRALSA